MALKTTMGRLLVNETLPPELQDYTRVLDKKGLNTLMSRLAKEFPDEYSRVSKRIADIGRESSTETGGNSFGPEHMVKSKEGVRYEQILRKKVKEILDDDSMPDEERNGAIIKALGSMQNEANEAVLQESLKEDNPLALQVISGARGNRSSLNSLRFGDMLYSDHNDEVIPLPVLKSYSQGLSDIEYWAGTYGARKGTIATKFATADAGYFCLPGGTMVRMADSSVKAIEKIQVGDMVLGADRKGNTFPVKVTNAFDNGPRVVWKFHFDFAFYVIATPEHRVLADNEIICPLDSFDYGVPFLLHTTEGSYNFRHKEPLGTCQTYDIEVDHPDHLFVLESGAIVSNSKQLNQAGHRLIVVDEEDEDERRKDWVRGMPVDTLDNDNEGALLAQDTAGYQKNTVLTPKVLKDIHKKGLQRILIRSPITSNSPEGGVYARDVGVREHGVIPGRGEPVGLTAAQMLCLDEDTEVRMADGSVKKIKDIEIGNMVLGSDLQGIVRPVSVLHKFNNGIQKCYLTEFEDYQLRCIEVVSTLNHKLLTESLEDATYGVFQIRPIEETSAITMAVISYGSGVCFRSQIGQRYVGLRQTYDIHVDHPDHLFVLANGLIVSNSEPISQGQLNVKHTGGVAGQNKSHAGFSYIDKLVQNPKTMIGAATHSEEDGIVSSIKDSDTGGKFIRVGSKDHYVPHNINVTVKPGQVVEAGDVLSDGIPSPAKVVEHKGIGEGKRYFVNTFHTAMKNSGMRANRRNVELLARGLINHVRVNQLWGDHLPDDLIPYSTLESTYEPRDGFQSLAPDQALGQYLETPTLHYTIGTKIRPSMLRDLKDFGIKTLNVHKDKPLFEPEMQRAAASIQNDPDWMTRLYGSGQKKSLLDAVHRGGQSDEMGTSFVPGMAYGKNFNTTGLVRVPEKGKKPTEIGDGIFKVSSEIQELDALHKKTKELPWRNRVEILARNPDGKLYGGTWDTDKSFALPGGGIDDGEEITAAAMRELQEETGLLSANSSLLPIDPVDNPWDDEHRKRTGRNFAGSRTHFVLSDITGKDENQKLDKWNAGNRGFYSPEEALAIMQANTNYLTPAVAAARVKALEHIIGMKKQAVSSYIKLGTQKTAGDSRVKEIAEHWWHEDGSPKYHSPWISIISRTMEKYEVSLDEAAHLVADAYGRTHPEDQDRIDGIFDARDRLRGVDKQAAISYVPTSVLESVKKNGLYSGEALLKNPELLRLAAQGRGETEEVFSEGVHNVLAGWKANSAKGPNILFSDIPKDIQLPPNHPLKKWNLSPVNIDLDALLKDIPDTKVHGQELEPYEEYLKRWTPEQLEKNEDQPSYRHRDLTAAELKTLQERKDLWANYSDPDNKGMYAPNVPHASVRTPDGVIPPKYLKFAAEIQDLDSLHSKVSESVKEASDSRVAEIADKYLWPEGNPRHRMLTRIRVAEIAKTYGVPLSEAEKLWEEAQEYRPYNAAALTKLQEEYEASPDSLINRIRALSKKAEDLETPKTPGQSGPSAYVNIPKLPSVPEPPKAPETPTTQDVLKKPFGNGVTSEGEPLLKREKPAPTQPTPSAPTGSTNSPIQMVNKPTATQTAQDWQNQAQKRMGLPVQNDPRGQAGNYPVSNTKPQPKNHAQLPEGVVNPLNQNPFNQFMDMLGQLSPELRAQMGTVDPEGKVFGYGQQTQPRGSVNQPIQQPPQPQGNQQQPYYPEQTHQPKMFGTLKEYQDAYNTIEQNILQMDKDDPAQKPKLDELLAKRRAIAMDLTGGAPTNFSVDPTKDLDIRAIRYGNRFGEGANYQHPVEQGVPIVQRHTDADEHFVQNTANGVQTRGMAQPSQTPLKPIIDTKKVYQRPMFDDEGNVQLDEQGKPKMISFRQSPDGTPVPAEYWFDETGRMRGAKGEFFTRGMGGPMGDAQTDLGTLNKSIHDGHNYLRRQGMEHAGIPGVFAGHFAPYIAGNAIMQTVNKLLPESKYLTTKPLLNDPKNFSWLGKQLQKTMLTRNLFNLDKPALPAGQEAKPGLMRRAWSSLFTKPPVTTVPTPGVPTTGVPTTAPTTTGTKPSVGEPVPTAKPGVPEAGKPSTAKKIVTKPLGWLGSAVRTMPTIDAGLNTIDVGADIMEASEQARQKGEDPFQAGENAYLERGKLRHDFLDRAIFGRKRDEAGNYEEGFNFDHYKPPVEQRDRFWPWAKSVGLGALHTGTSSFDIADNTAAISQGLQQAQKADDTNLATRVDNQKVNTNQLEQYYLKDRPRYQAAMPYLKENAALHQAYLDGITAKMRDLDGSYRSQYTPEDLKYTHTDPTTGKTFGYQDYLKYKQEHDFTNQYNTTARNPFDRRMSEIERVKADPKANVLGDLLSTDIEHHQQRELESARLDNLSLDLFKMIQSQDPENQMFQKTYFPIKQTRALEAKMKEMEIPEEYQAAIKDRWERRDTLGLKRDTERGAKERMDANEAKRQAESAARAAESQHKFETVKTKAQDAEDKYLYGPIYEQYIKANPESPYDLNQFLAQERLEFEKEKEKSKKEYVFQGGQFVIPEYLQDFTSFLEHKHSTKGDTGPKPFSFTQPQVTSPVRSPVRPTIMKPPYDFSGFKPEYGRDGESYGSN